MRCTTWGASVWAQLGKMGQMLPIVVTVLLLSLPAFSQVNLGRIDGTVTDQTGGAIVGATVTVTDVARGITRNLTTDSAGAYSAPNLTPGTYTVHVAFTGFKSIDRQDVQVGVGQDIRVDARLQPGEQSQTVTVTGEPPAITTTNAQLGGTIESETATDLPIAGRTFLFLLNYRPGVLTKPGAGGGIIQYSNGLRPEYNVYDFDGLADTNSYGAAGPLNIGYIAGGPDESVILTIDAVQEFNLVENPKAEYGWRPGVQVNIGLKSGTNDPHGSGFALGRDTALDTRNPFFAQKAPTQFENFGGTFGGAIKKNKVFYYLGYEGQRYNVGNPRTLIVPTTAAGLGPSNSLPDAAAALINGGHGTPASLALGLNLAGCTVAGAAPAAVVTCTPGKGLFSNNLSTTSFPTDYPDIGATDNGVMKLDYHISDRDTVNLDFFRGIGTVTAPVSNVTQPYWASPLLGSVTVGRLVWTRIISSSMVNEVRGGWDYSLQAASPSPDCASGSGAPSYSALGFVSGSQICGFPVTVINGFGSAAAPTLGQPQGITDKSLNYRFSDNLSYTKGNHQWKFGVEYARQIFDGRTAMNLSKGTINFGTPGAAAFTGATPLEDFIAMVPSQEQIQVGNLRRTLTYNQYAFYGQDDWRLTPRLTLNLGLRYEYQDAIRESNNLLANFNPASPTGLTQSTGNALYNTSPWSLGPRIGLAWDVTGKGTTVVRSGFDIMYYQYVSQNFAPLSGTQPGLQNDPAAFNFVRPNGTVVTTPGATANLGILAINSPAHIVSGQSIFGGVVAGPGSCGPGTGTLPSPCKIAAVTSNLQTPMFYMWNLGIQHAITSSMTLDVSYVGNHGQHEFDYIDINQPTPGTAGAAAEQARRPYTVSGQFPWFSNIYQTSSFQISNYNAMQATLTQRVTHGLNFTAGYTWAHALNDNVGDVQATVPQNSLNPGAEYGNDIQDVRNRFTLQGNYMLPGMKSPGQILEGWQISSAVQIWSALPYSPVDATDDISGTGEGQDRWDLVGNAGNFNGFGGVSAIPCYGIPGSTFYNAKGCVQEASLASMPAACVSAAAGVPTGPGGSTDNGTASLTKYGCYMSRNGAAVIVPPAQGTFGTTSRFQFRGQGFSEWDMSLMKNWLLKERFNVQFRAEFFNLLNMTQYAPLSATNGASLAQPGKFGATTGTPNIVGQSPIIGNGDTRRIQLGLRFQF